MRAAGLCGHPQPLLPRHPEDMDRGFLLGAAPGLAALCPVGYHGKQAGPDPGNPFGSTVTRPVLCIPGEKEDLPVICEQGVNAGGIHRQVPEAAGPDGR